MKCVRLASSSLSLMLMMSAVAACKSDSDSDTNYDRTTAAALEAIKLTDQDQSQVCNTSTLVVFVGNAEHLGTYKNLKDSAYKAGFEALNAANDKSFEESINAAWNGLVSSMARSKCLSMPTFGGVTLARIFDGPDVNDSAVETVSYVKNGTAANPVHKTYGVQVTSNLDEKVYQVKLQEDAHPQPFELNLPRSFTSIVLGLIGANPASYQNIYYVFKTHGGLYVENPGKPSLLDRPKPDKSHHVFMFDAHGADGKELASNMYSAFWYQQHACTIYQSSSDERAKQYYAAECVAASNTNVATAQSNGAAGQGNGSAGQGNGSAGQGNGSAGQGNGSAGQGNGSAGQGNGSAGQGNGSAGQGNGSAGQGNGSAGQGNGSAGQGNGSAGQGNGSAGQGNGSAGQGNGSAGQGNGSAGQGNGSAGQGNGSAGQGNGSAGGGKSGFMVGALPTIDASAPEDQQPDGILQAGEAASYAVLSSQLQGVVNIEAYTGIQINGYTEILLDSCYGSANIAQTISNFISPVKNLVNQAQAKLGMPKSTTKIVVLSNQAPVYYDMIDYSSLRGDLFLALPILLYKGLKQQAPEYRDAIKTLNAHFNSGLIFDDGFAKRNGVVNDYTIDDFKTLFADFLEI